MKLSALPELLIAFIALGSAAGGAYALAGLAGAVVAVVAFTGVALAVAGWLVPASSAPPSVPNLAGDDRRPSTWFNNYWYLEMRLNNGTKSFGSYRAELGPQLQHLLAARLAEHHGVNLYTQPEVARRLFCKQPGDDELWAWVAPQDLQERGDKHGEQVEPAAETAQTTSQNRDAPGISPRALAKLVTKLERL